jgi:hypothetical protein
MKPAYKHLPAENIDSTTVKARVPEEAIPAEGVRPPCPCGAVAQNCGSPPTTFRIKQARQNSF